MPQRLLWGAHSSTGNVVTARAAPGVAMWSPRLCIPNLFLLSVWTCGSVKLFLSLLLSLGQRSWLFPNSTIAVWAAPESSNEATALTLSKQPTRLESKGKTRLTLILVDISQGSTWEQPLPLKRTTMGDGFTLTKIHHLFFCGINNWSQGFVYTRRELYHWAISSTQTSQF